MRKALAQNPNLLRTLIGMGLTLIFLLAYAVYGATINTEVYIYESDSTESQVSLDNVDKYYDSQGNQNLCPNRTPDGRAHGVNHLCEPDSGGGVFVMHPQCR